MRWDYAFFQMAVETNFLSFKRGDGSWGDVKPAQNNFAGFGTTGGGVPGDSYPRCQHRRAGADPASRRLLGRARQRARRRAHQAEAGRHPGNDGALQGAHHLLRPLPPLGRRQALRRGHRMGRRQLSRDLLHADRGAKTCRADAKPHRGQGCNCRQPAAAEFEPVAALGGPKDGESERRRRCARSGRGRKTTDAAAADAATGPASRTVPAAPCASSTGARRRRQAPEATAPAAPAGSRRQSADKPLVVPTPVEVRPRPVHAAAAAAANGGRAAAKSLRLRRVDGRRRNRCAAPLRRRAAASSLRATGAPRRCSCARRPARSCNTLRSPCSKASRSRCWPAT